MPDREMTMVERCARKLAAQHYADRFRLPEDAPLVMTNVDGNWYIFVNQVMTVIGEMREPTPAMEDAADDPVHQELKNQRQFSLAKYGKLAFASYPFSVAVWQSMIDAALKEHDGA